MQTPKPLFEVPVNSSFSLEEIKCYLLNNGFVRLDFSWSGEEIHKQLFCSSAGDENNMVFMFEDESVLCLSLDTSDYKWELIDYSDFSCSVYFSNNNWKSVENKEPYIHWKKE